MHPMVNSHFLAPRGWHWLTIAISCCNVHTLTNSTNRTIPEWPILHRFPTKQRLTTSRPDAILENEMPTKKAKNLPDVHPRYALRSRTGCRGG